MTSSEPNLSQPNLSQPNLSQPNFSQSSQSSREEKLFQLPPRRFRQNFRNWRVTPPSFGNTTGLSIIFEGDSGCKIYLNSKSLIKISNLIRNDNIKTGKGSFQFQEPNASFIARSVSNQKSRNPSADLKVALRYIRFNRDSQVGLVYQKTHPISMKTNGNFDLDEDVVLEQTGITINMADFMEPFNHITDSDDELNYSHKGSTAYEDDV